MIYHESGSKSLINPFEHITGTPVINGFSIYIYRRERLTVSFLFGQPCLGVWDQFWSLHTTNLEANLILFHCGFVKIWCCCDVNFSELGWTNSINLMIDL